MVSNPSLYFREVESSGDTVNLKFTEIIHWRNNLYFILTHMQRNMHSSTFVFFYIVFTLNKMTSIRNISDILFFPEIRPEQFISFCTYEEVGDIPEVWRYWMRPSPRFFLWIFCMRLPFLNSHRRWTMYAKKVMKLIIHSSYSVPISRNKNDDPS
jgi:hypothetical protein